MMYEAVPQHMRACPQWLVWQPQYLKDKNKWTKIPLSTQTWQPSDVTNPATWCTFEVCCAAILRYPEASLGAGFALGFNSGVSGIDADGVFDNAGRVMKHNMVELAQRFNTYTELSPSRTGLHMLFGAQVPSGKRMNGLEVYGSGRYFTVTGLPYLNLPLEYRQHEVDTLIAEIDATRAATSKAPLDWTVQETISDEALCSQAASASNGSKFIDLWQGMWQSHYGSQSEADFALVDILAFYTNSPAQVARLFLMSGLGQRPKALREDYRNGLIARSFDRKVPLVDMSNFQAAPIIVGTLPPPPPSPADDDEEVTAAKKLNPYAPPPGLVGDIARYVYNQAPYPLEEAAILAGLALMAAICGRQYQYEGQGLNLYLMLLAETGAGKDAINSGINRIMDAICEPTYEQKMAAPSTGNVAIGFPAARDFIGPSVLTGRGVLRIFKDSKTLSCLALLTEFSRTMAELASPQAHQGARDFNRILLEFYSSSTEGQRFRGSMNSDKAQDIKPVASPAFSMMCEGTPEKFYRALTEELITDGMLGRFVVVEKFGYEDENPYFTQYLAVPEQLRQTLGWLMQKVCEMITQGDIRIPVAHTKEAKDRSDSLKLYYRNRGREDKGDSAKALWMRAHQNLTRIAALLAIGEQPSTPVVTLTHIEWANTFIYRQVVLIIGKFKRGEVGTPRVDEKTIQAAMLDILKRYIDKQPDDMKNAADRAARHAGLIGHSYIQSRTHKLAAFVAYPGGAKRALSDIIDTLKRNGVLIEQRMPNSTASYYRVELG